MHKSLLILLSFLISQNVFSQEILGGEIFYKVDPPTRVTQYMDTTNQNEIAKKVALKMYGELKKSTPFLNYKLNFSKTEAVFEQPNYMDNDNGVDMERVSGSVGVVGLYYTNLEENISLHQFSEIGTKWLVKSSVDDIEWVLTNETKVIKGYHCKKATTIVNLNYMKKDELIAWYCSEIPFQFGPMGLSGLPGMILEIKRRNFTIYADKINFKSKDMKLKRPTKGKLISEKEQLETVKKWSEKRFGK